MSQDLKIQALEAEVATIKTLMAAAQNHAPSAPVYDASDDVRKLRLEISSLKGQLADAQRNAAQAAASAATQAVRSGNRATAELIATGMAHAADTVTREAQLKFDEHGREIDLAKRQADKFEAAVLDGARISAGYILATAKAELEA